MRSLAVITLDSVRYDQFVKAKTPWMDSLGPAQEARAHADSTFPSHMQLLAGNLHVPLHRNAKEYFTGAPWLPTGFKQKGYTTICGASLAWVSKRMMGLDFDHFFYQAFAEKFGMARLFENLSAIGEVLADPTFLFLNIGETHFPYTADMSAPWDGLAPQMAKDPESIDRDDLEKMKQCQVETIGWVDEQLGAFFAEGDWVIYITSDHGELFGEHGKLLHGHGCYPEEVSVPVICNDWGVLVTGRL